MTYIVYFNTVHNVIFGCTCKHHTMPRHNTCTYIQDINKTNILSAYEVDRSAIIIQSDLGKGQFGKVSQAKMKNVLPGKAESVVAVKMLKGKCVHIIIYKHAVHCIRKPLKYIFCLMALVLTTGITFRH